jgi:hypothetical protein
VGSLVDDDDNPLEPGLLMAAVVHAAHRAWATHLSGRSPGEQVLLAASSGAVIDNDDMFSEDLILFRGEVIDDIADATPRGPHAGGTNVDWKEKSA